SILSRKVRDNSYATVDDSLLFDDVEVGRHCRIRRSIIDKGVKVPPGMSIGVDPELDRRRGFLCSEGGVVIIPKGENLDVAYARAPEPEA
ncbi:MAG TPA: glucose-1-phosphate adenylyltransferase, partial [Planctomycetia bacterium]|nr:glucose-1-phosphate adenylyltransferase [Planctomycetia bacterium]